MKASHGFPLVLVAALMPAFSSGSTSANPIVEEGLILDVRPWEPEGGCQDPATSCDQIFQFSSITGDVEFDLYAVDHVADGVDGFAASVGWPESWTFTQFEPCSNGISELQLSEFSAELTISYNPPLPLDREFVYLGRFRMAVDGFGALHVDPYQHTGGVYWVSVHGQAGVTCDYDAGSCDPCCRQCCCAYLSSSVLELKVESGQVGSESFSLPSHYGNDCNPAYSAQAPWAEVTILDEHHGELTADATHLDPGTYDTEVMIECDRCRRCVQVILTVLDPSPVEPVSWGTIKAVYREKSE